MKMSKASLRASNPRISFDPSEPGTTFVGFCPPFEQFEVELLGAEIPKAQRPQVLLQRRRVRPDALAEEIPRRLLH